jgi:hypothetical protein
MPALTHKLMMHNVPLPPAGVESVNAPVDFRNQSRFSADPVQPDPGVTDPSRTVHFLLGDDSHLYSP